MPNLSVIPGKHPVETFEEHELDLQEFCKAFTWAFHEIEIHPPAHELPTFSTPYRYKRLWFGMKNATEQLVKILTEFLMMQGATDCL